MTTTGWFEKGHKLNVGRICSEETRKKISASHKGYKFTPEQLKRLSESHMGQKAWNTGKPWSEEHKKLLSKIHKGKCDNTGRTHIKKGQHLSPATEYKSQSNIPYPYGREFRIIRNDIKIRDGYRCQECFRHQNELQKPLEIHHIDFNKINNNPKNLITLCRPCHIQTLYDKQNWVEYYQNQMVARGL